MTRFTLAAFVCLTLVSCGQRGFPGLSVQVRDILGREVRVPERAARIVSLAPSNTELMYALGAERLLVGVTIYCDWPEAAKALPKVGDLRSPGLERIAGLAPDLVIAGNRLEQTLVDGLANLGIPVVVLEARNIPEVFTSIALLGRLTGFDAQASAAADRLRMRFAALREKVRGLERPSCFFIVSHGEWGNWAAGPGSFIDELITLAGGVNAAAGLSRPWGEYTVESLLVLDPDILLMSSDAGDADALNRAAGYRAMRAIRNKSLFVVNGDLVSRPGPRLADGLEAMARVIHPEARW